MKLGIMQPYFFPYLGYFDLINASDHWVVFDTAQYIRHGWVNRNRILHPAESWSYIIAPVNVSRETLIQNVKIAEDGKWKQRIRGQLQHYKKRAPFYSQVMELLEDCFTFEGVSLSGFNVFSLQKVCAFLGIRFECEIFSHMNLPLGLVEGPGDWALRISQALGAEEYVNPPGGEHLFDREKFSAAHIKLNIRHLPALAYTCSGYEFIPGLSILDVLMWNRPGDVKNFLDEHRNEGQEND